MAIPQEVSKKLIPVVKRLAQEVILQRGDWETTVYFQNMLSESNTHFTLAEIAVEVRREKPNWERLREQVEELDEEVKVPQGIFDLISLSSFVQDMMGIPRENQEYLDELLNLSKESESDMVYGVMKDLIQKFQEGSEQHYLQEEPFSSDYIKLKFNRWLKKCLSRIEYVQVPRALQKRKRPSEGVETQEQVNELRRARKDLKKSVQDPLDEVRQVAKGAHRGRMYEKKKSATRLEFDDEDEIDEFEFDDDDEARGTHQLSAVPKRMVTPKKRKIAPVSGTPGSSERKKRVVWTQEQRVALKAALAEFGLSNWALIRDSERYREYWNGKTNVQLKDLYRTMLKRGDIREGEFVKKSTPRTEKEDEEAEEEDMKEEEEAGQDNEDDAEDQDMNEGIGRGETADV